MLDTIQLKQLIPYEIETKDVGSYRMNVRNAIRRFWTGNGTIDDFVEDMDRVLRLGYEDAWRTGAAVCGIKPEERTPEEQKELDKFILNHRQYIFGFGEAIEANTRAEGGALGPLMTRGELWINRYNEVKNTAASMACADMKLMWRWNPLKEHCSDCRRLNGRVYRASTWQKMDIHPQDTRPDKLDCHGFRCGCEFVQTDAPITRGRPPQY